MTTARLSRRRFLMVAGAGLGATALTCSGLTALGSHAPSIDFPKMTLGETNMSNKILVAYASQAGSTAGVAEAIGRTLAEYGSQVEVRRMQEVTDVSPYRAVVAGSAIHGGKWLPEAMQFMQAHQTALRQKPFAAFLVCITLSMRDAGKYRSGVADWMKPVRALVAPASEGLFAGALDFTKLPVTKDSLLMHLPVMFGAWKLGDHRDWDAIHAWAADLKPLLGA
jgi:menaquinone-dependent protoporphyrinogen oxidase